MKGEYIGLLIVYIVVSERALIMKIAEAFLHALIDYKV